MIHKLADVQTGKIGQGTKIWQFCVVLEGAVIGTDCNINCHVFIENDVIIGNNVTIKPGVQIWDGLRIDNNVFIGPNVTFINDLIPRSQVRPHSFIQTNIGEGASIGANSTIMAGITIGTKSLIGAGSMVTRSVPAYTVWYGNPAVQKGYIDDGKEILTMDLKDRRGNQYILIDGKPCIK
jgi:acetyltransferase-like isoleucine patch superfamily enzyme